MDTTIKIQRLTEYKPLAYTHFDEFLQLACEQTVIRTIFLFLNFDFPNLELNYKFKFFEFSNLYSFQCVKFPKVLTNKEMHSINGNGVREEERFHKVAPSVIPIAQGFTVEHNVKWEAGDRIINGISSIFGSKPERARTISDSFLTCDEEGIDYMSFLKSKYSLILFLLTSLVIYVSCPNHVTRTILYVSIGFVLTYVTFVEPFEGIDSLELHNLWSQLEKDKSEVEMEIVPQAFDLKSSTFATIILATISVLAGFKAKRSILEGVLNASRISESQTSNVSLLLLKMTGTIHDYLVSISQEGMAKYFYVDAIDDQRVSDFQTRVMSFVASFNSGNPESMIYCMDVYKSLYEEGRNLSSILDKKSFDHKIVFDCTNKLQTVHQKIRDSKVSLNGERVEPVGILFKGSPATMKGVLTKRVAKVLAIATIPKEWKPAYLEDSRDFFASVPKDQFWDSYTNKAWVVFFDDIFQRRDAVADSDADALKIIEMINSAPFPLKMADIRQKNNVFFRSPFVIANSNLVNWASLNSVTDYTAVQRRFHFEVDVKINKKYLDGNSKVDTSKLPFSDLYDDSSEIPNDFWKLTLVEKVGSKVKDSVEVTLVEMIEKIISRHQRHKKNFFVNRRTEDVLVENLAEQLGYGWAEDYSEHSSVFEPQGLTSTRLKIKRYLSSLPRSQLEAYDFLFWAKLDKMRRLDLYERDFCTSIDNYLSNGLTYPDLEASMHDAEELVETLEKHFRDFITVGINPYSRKKEWLQIQGYSVSPVDRLLNFFKDSLAFIRKHWVIFLAGAGAFYVGIGHLKKFFEVVVGDPQSVDIKRMGKRVGGPKRTITLSHKIKPDVSPQGGLPPNFEFSGLPKFDSSNFGLRSNKNDVVAKVFNKYFFLVYLVDHAGQDGQYEVLRLGHATNVVAQLFLIPFHFIFIVDEYRKRDAYKGATMVFVTSSGSNRYSISLEEFLDSFKTTESASNRDLCLIKVSSAQRMSKGAISSFLNRKDIENLLRTTSFSALVLGSFHPDVYKDAIAIRSHYVQAAFDKGSRMIAATWEKDNSVYNLYETYSYRLNCSVGDCGSLLIASDSNFENRILCGLHVAGGADMGFATSIDREGLDDLIFHTFGKQQAFEEEEIPEFLLMEELDCQSGLRPIATLESSYIPGEIFKSEIRKSKFFGKLPRPYNMVKSMPAKLKPFYDKEGNIIDPLLKAFNKYGKQAPDIPIGLVERAIQSYENLIIKNDRTTSTDRQIVPLERALHSFDNINSISSSTSAGFPMSLPNQTNLKKIYYQSLHENKLEEAQEAYQRIATLVELILDSYRKGLRPFFAYKQCGKDETREWFKVLEGKTRLFSACPFLLLVIFRMYFGSFISMFVRENSDLGSAVGVNPYSTDWDVIARKLLRFSDSEDECSIAAGDQGGFDTRQWTIVHNGILDMINRWYDGTEEETYIRSALFMEITNSRHVFRGKVYEWYSGLPSGNPLTAIINTIYNNVIFRMSWEIAGLDIVNFNANCYLIVLGDDNVFSVSKQFREIFNEMTMPNLMEQIGNEYTTELKGEAVTPFRKLSEIEFLKRSFRKDKQLNRWVAPLRESAIAEMLNWTKKNKEGDQISADNMVFAIREFSLHGKEKFDFWKKALIAIKQEVLPLVEPHGDIPLNFEDCYIKVLGLEYFF